MVIWFQNQIAVREEHLLNLWVLLDLLVRRGGDEFVKLTFPGSTIFHLSAFKAYPGDTHRLHIFLSRISGALGFERSELSNSLPCLGPLNAGEHCARIVR